MQEQPLVSIIIPTYNRAHLIGETLDSVWAQTYQNWECIVVDDGSTDGTDALMAEYVAMDSRFQYHHRPDSHLPGGNGARNYGFKLSKGMFVNWLDSDDVFASHKIQIQLEKLFSTNYKVGVSLSEFFYTTPKDNRNHLWSELSVSEEGVLYTLITQKMRWPTCAILWSRSVLSNNGWDESLKAGQEWHFHIIQALKLKDSDFSFIDKVLSYIRNGNSSITNDELLVNRYSNYLKARVILLDYLFVNNRELFGCYSYHTYNFALKYIKHLIRANRYNTLFPISNLIYKVSKRDSVLFWYGVSFYKIFKKHYFLKLVLKNI